ncbi:acyltransferase [Telluria mixta]|uniref:Acyltransferase n=1 Tax=Telluria mixta TaxID=34071 RepID=A0ABT2C501_9BURK|nr:acyltransferase [Telluria mixta]MCS0632469.1 acyltransferase [Telluria mixta]WEM99231.1 acyltransferase [Telluria mixta]
MRTVVRQNNFNLIRLILALLVLLSHAFELIDGDRRRELLTQMFGSMSFGELAVDGFFLLSGYLIMQSWSAQPQAWPFLRKRLLRIYPGFLVATLVCAFIVGPLAAEPATYFDALDIQALVVHMLFLQKPAVPDVFAGLHHEGINNSMWSISAEFLCYLSVLVLGVSGSLRNRRKWFALTMLILTVGVAARMVNLTIPGMRLAMLFLCGGTYYLYRDKIRMDGRVALGAVVIVLLCMFSWRLSELAVTTVGGYALLYVASKRSALLSQFNRLPDVSYGAYLYGWPIQKLLIWYVPTISPWSLFVLSTLCALLAGAVSWCVIEEPALRFKGPHIRVPEATAEPLTQ